MSLITNHTDKVGLIIEGYNRLPTFKALVKVLLEEVDILESKCQDLYDDRHLDSAIGMQLDQIGALVGELRQGRTDDVYRQYIKLRVAINTSQGTVEDVIKVIELLFGDDVDVIINRTGKALISVYIGIEEPTEDLIPLLEQTIPAGVKIGEIIYPSSRLPWIPVERGGIVQDTGILPEIGDNSPTVRIPPERVTN